MLTFNDSPLQAEKLRKQMAEHHAADEITQGLYWMGGRGCFIGCLTHSNGFDNQDRAAELVGWPVAAVVMAETIFEELNETAARLFAVELLRVNPVGKDASRLPDKMLDWAMLNAYSMFDGKVTRDYPLAREICEAVNNRADGFDPEPELLSALSGLETYMSECSGIRLTPYGEALFGAVRALLYPKSVRGYRVALRALLDGRPGLADEARYAFLNHLRKL